MDRRACGAVVPAHDAAEVLAVPHGAALDLAQGDELADVTALVDGAGDGPATGEVGDGRLVADLVGR